MQRPQAPWPLKDISIETIEEIATMAAKAHEEEMEEHRREHGDEDELHVIDVGEWLEQEITVAPSRQAVYQMVHDLPHDELEAVMWVGRGDSDTFDAALASARNDFPRDHQAAWEYIAHKPLEDYLPAGLQRMAANAEKRTIDDWMVGWNPVGPRNQHDDDDRPGEVRVGPRPDYWGWSDAYDFTTGCCEVVRQTKPLWQKIALMFIDFNTLVVGNGIDPQAAHREFLKIDEYRRRISPDIKGAED